MKDLKKRMCTALIAGTLFFGTLLFLPARVFSSVLLATLLIILGTEFRLLAYNTSYFLWILASIYPILPFVLLIALNEQPEYRILLFITFILVFSFDIGSYFAGNLFGKHHIAPSISPGKTWEGFVGGIITTTIILLLFFWFKQLAPPLFTIVSISSLICVAALVGDLFESYLKRCAQIKDSGRLLPGHGGLLDRFDGVLSTVFLVYMFKDWFIHLLH